MIRKLKIFVMTFLQICDYFVRIPMFYYHLYFNNIVKKQLYNIFEIPVIIINYNQLFFLKQNIARLFEVGFKNIIIIDNNSTYKKLLEYYDDVLINNENITIERLNNNWGHLVLYKNNKLFRKYCKGFYILSDADIILNTKLPKNFLQEMLDLLKSKHFFITKVGVALDISDIPNEYPLKDKVLKWEMQFWEKPCGSNAYYADIDTTFALYKPNFFPFKFSNFLKGIRMAEDFTAKHGGWYILPQEFEDERKFYFKENISSTWLYNNDGNLEKKGINEIYH